MLKKRKKRMTKIAAQCTRHCAALVLRNFPPPFPLLPNQLWCNSIGSLSLQSSLAVGFLECTSSVLVFVPWFICIMIMPLSSLSLFLVVPHSWLPLVSCWIRGSWILDLLLPYYSSIFLLSWFFLFLPSHTLMFVICDWLSCPFFSIFVIPLFSICWLLCHFF